MPLREGYRGAGFVLVRELLDLDAMTQAAAFNREGEALILIRCTIRGWDGDKFADWIGDRYYYLHECNLEQ